MNKNVMILENMQKQRTGTGTHWGLVDDLRMKCKTAKTIVLIKYLTMELPVWNFWFLNISDQEKASTSAHLMIQFGYKNTAVYGANL
jgi:hypothetical protein